MNCGRKTHYKVCFGSTKVSEEICWFDLGEEGLAYGQKRAPIGWEVNFRR